jgi:hypothetical protein
MPLKQRPHLTSGIALGLTNTSHKLHFSHQPVFEEDRPIEDPTRGTNQLVRN